MFMCLQDLLVYAYLLPTTAAPPIFLLLLAIAIHCHLNPCIPCLSALLIIYLTLSPLSPFYPSSPPSFYSPASTSPPSFYSPASTSPPSFYSPASTSPPSFYSPASTSPPSFYSPASTSPPSFYSPASTSPPLSSPLEHRTWLSLNHAHIFDPTLYAYHPLSSVPPVLPSPANSTIVPPSTIPTPTPKWKRLLPFLRPSPSPSPPSPSPPPHSASVPDMREGSPVGMPKNYVDVSWKGFGLVLDFGLSRSDEGLEWERAQRKSAAHDKDFSQGRNADPEGREPGRIRVVETEGRGGTWRSSLPVIGEW